MADMSSVTNTCWEQATAGELQTGPSSLGSSDWRDGRAYTNYNGTVVNSTAINLFSNVDREWLMLDYYDLSGTANDVLTVEVAVTDYTFSGTSAATASDAMGSDDEVHLLVSEDRGATWSVLKTWDSTTSPVATGERSYIDISAYNGVVRFAFLATDGTVDDVADYDFHVGEFIIDTTASNDVVEAPVSEVSLYPNPVAGDYLNIAMGVDAANVSIMVYNTLGQQVMARDYTNAGQEIRLDGLTNLNAGVYIINIAIDDRVTTRRFIKE
jgi:predicted heme/steroid binding protein